MSYLTRADDSGHFYTCDSQRSVLFNKARDLPMPDCLNEITTAPVTVTLNIVNRTDLFSESKWSFLETVSGQFYPSKQMTH